MVMRTFVGQAGHVRPIRTLSFIMAAAGLLCRGGLPPAYEEVGSGRNVREFLLLKEIEHRLAGIRIRFYAATPPAS